MREKEINLLVFDLDGTLIDSRLDIFKAINNLAKDLNKPPLAYERLASAIGDGSKMLIHKLLQIPNNTPEMEHAFKLFVEHYADDLIGQSRFFPHALETLAYYSDKKKAILTNKPQQLTVAILKALKIDSHFMAVVGADDRFGRKPETAGILHIIRKAGTIPEKTIMIGDGDTDILVGKRAGTFTCALANGFRSRELLEMLDPDFLLEDLSQLRNIL